MEVTFKQASAMYPKKILTLRVSSQELTDAIRNSRGGSITLNVSKPHTLYVLQID